MDATLEEDVSLHDKLMQKLQPEPPQTEEDVQEEVEETIEAEPVAELDPVEESPEEETFSEERTYDLNQISEIIGFDADRLDVNDSGELVFKTKVGDQEGTATLSQLIKERQLESHLNQKDTEVTELKKKLQKKLAESDAKINENLSQADNFIKAAYQLAMSEFESIDWNSLKQEDREEYLLKKSEFEERKNQFGELYGQFQSAKPKVDEDQVKEKLAEEKANLIKSIPEWADNSVLEKEYKELLDFSPKLNFSPEEVQAVTDHRALVILRKAMLYDKLKTEDPKITKVVRKAPKLVKTVGTQKPKIDEAKKLKENIIAKQGKGGSIAQYLLQTGKVK